MINKEQAEILKKILKLQTDNTKKETFYKENMYKIREDLRMAIRRITATVEATNISGMCPLCPSKKEYEVWADGPSMLREITLDAAVGLDLYNICAAYVRMYNTLKEEDDNDGK